MLRQRHNCHISKLIFPGQRWIPRSKGSFPFCSVAERSIWWAIGSSEVNWQWQKCDSPHIPMWHNSQLYSSVVKRYFLMLSFLVCTIIDGDYLWLPLPYSGSVSWIQVVAIFSSKNKKQCLYFAEKSSRWLTGEKKCLESTSSMQASTQPPL